MNASRLARGLYAGAYENGPAWSKLPGEYRQEWKAYATALIHWWSATQTVTLEEEGGGEDPPPRPPGGPPVIGG